MLKKDLEKILFIRSDRLGEFLLSLPAIKAVKSNYPKSKVYLLAKKENTELINGIDFIDSFLEYEEKRFKSYGGALRLSRIFKKEKIDCIITLNPKKEFHLASFLAGVPLRLGYDRKWGFCLNRKIEDRKSLAQKHEVEYNLDLIRLLCPQVFVPEVNLVTDSKDNLEFLKNDLDIKKQYIVLHPFSSNPSKKIERQFWEKLIAAFKKQDKEEIVIIGGPEELEESLTFAKGLAVKNITGKLRIRNLASFLKYNCSVFIGLDSGPMHLASTLKKPVVGLFSISNSKRWGPFNTEALVIESVDLEGFIARIEDIVMFVRKKLTIGMK
ncbi:MAG: glycosyltransferase family 9 protein [Candidatus Omnitrophota bacterium]|nr:glycosyltransferase family 9 protein [Candidatus Omnitrophota bacterium]